MPTRNELLEVCIKYGALFTYISIGVAGIFGLDIVNNKKITGLYAFGTLLCALFVGYITGAWCDAHAPEKAKWIVPMATLASRDIIILIKSLDYQKILSIILKEKLTKKK